MIAIKRKPSIWCGSLVFLSLMHCPRFTPVPPPPSNRDRYLAFRKAWLPPLRNTLTDDGRSLTSAHHIPPGA